jgi:NhaC family Na+:H+ antiporter
LAGLFAVIFQPHLLDSIAGNDAGGIATRFKGLLITFYGSTQIETGNVALDELVATRGMGGMMNTIWLILCAMSFGAAMTASGMLESIISVLLRFMKRTVGMVASTVVAGLFFNITTADQYMSIILTGNMFKDIYRDKGYESRLLGRTIEDAVTVTSPLVPWNTCGMTQSTVLGVSAFTYLPYCFFNYISPLMSITLAAIGYKIYRKKETTQP